MASTKDLKKRIGTVKNTQQTTRAMKMVSAAKLRRAQDAIKINGLTPSASGDLIQLLSSTCRESQYIPRLVARGSRRGRRRSVLAGCGYF